MTPLCPGAVQPAGSGLPANTVFRRRRSGVVDDPVFPWGGPADRPHEAKVRYCLRVQAHAGEREAGYHC